MYNIKTTLPSVSISTLLSLTLIACGSDNEDSPISSKKYDCKSIIEQVNLPTLTTKLSATGQLSCKQLYGYPTLEFTDGVNEIAISQFISTKVFDSDLVVGTITINLQNATEHIVGTDATNGAVDCINTYDINTPITIYSSSAFSDISISDYQLKNSTCPSWVQSNDYETKVTRMTMTEEATITDDKGVVSTFSSYLNY